VCKADNTQGPTCRRCKADLSLLFDLEQQRAQKLAAAQQFLAAGQGQEAVEQAAAADWLRRDQESRRLLALAYLLARDFSRAWEEYRDLQKGSSGS
jgi:hypothetical protein